MGKARILVLGEPDTLRATVNYLRATGDFEVVGLLARAPLDDGDFCAPVLGSFDNLPEILAAHPIDYVVLSSRCDQATAQILNDAAHYGIPVRILPAADDLLSDRLRVTRSLTQTEIDRALDATGVEIDTSFHPALVETFRERTVLITGAAGSIGSELSRQAAQLPVSRLVLFDHDENTLVELGDLLRGSGSPVEFVPVIGDIRDQDLVHHIFRTFLPQVVLHAAAYKHVPALEENSCEAVLNNVSGTRILAHAAIEADAERFLLISTDKAVNPSSVMGATKRAAELVVQQQAGEAALLGRKTRLACVRFVNVLGSRGSVVPIFLRQIAEGGPVTITHEEMTRYFMTIPQATHLVLQASTLDSAGSIYMLEIGDPIRIVECARELIRMSGLEPERQIKFELIGIRRGEKLHEQPAVRSDALQKTIFSYIYQVPTQPVPPGFAARLAAIESAARARQSGHVVELLSELPIDYQPAGAVSPNAISS